VNATPLAFSFEFTRGRSIDCPRTHCVPIAVIKICVLVIELVWVLTDVLGVEELIGFQDMSQELGFLNNMERRGEQNTPSCFWLQR